MRKRSERESESAIERAANIFLIDVEVSGAGSAAITYLPRLELLAITGFPPELKREEKFAHRLTQQLGLGSFEAEGTSS